VTFTEALYDIDEQAIVLYTSADIRRTTPVTITTPEYRSLWYYKLGEQRWFLPALSAFAEAETIDYYAYMNEAAGISTISAETWIDEAVFSWYYQEPCTATVEIVSASVELQPVSTLPI